jgi:hypothetical protein
MALSACVEAQWTRGSWCRSVLAMFGLSFHSAACLQGFNGRCPDGGITSGEQGLPAAFPWL